MRRSTTTRRFFLTWLFLSSCGVQRALQSEQLTIGTLDYEAGTQSIAKYDRFKQYLAEQLQSLVQIEPTYNESKALERIAAQAWSLVFAPPGLAAIAMSQHQYTPLIPLVGIDNLRSILVVKQDSPYQDLKSLSGKKVALGQPGSATGYYYPIFNLYGTTLAEVIVSATPKAILTAVADGTADAGAMSVQEFNTYRTTIPQTEFRVLFTDTHQVPMGVILVSPTIERNLQESIRKILKDTPSPIAQEVGSIPNGTVPDYKYTIAAIERVRSIFASDRSPTAALLRQKPVRLFEDKSSVPSKATSSK
jgi:phosphonate transport system substrate-binding protein